MRKRETLRKRAPKINGETLRKRETERHRQTLRKRESESERVRKKVRKKIESCFGLMTFINNLRMFRNSFCL